MKETIIYILLCFPLVTFAQSQKDSTETYKKRVLDNTEINMLTSFYTQTGSNAAVTGGVGTEELYNIAENINIAIPLTDDDVLTIDGTISAYSSASSSNLSPFSGASEDDDEENNVGGVSSGSPWVASSSEAKEDVWYNGIIGYSRTSDDRNHIYHANLSFAVEYDYVSTGAKIDYTRLLNRKNTEFGIGANVYIDKWNPQYPIEIKTYIKNNGNLNAGFFSLADILDVNGNVTDKNGANTWKPLNKTLVENKSRNTYSVSLSFSQILSKRMQVSVFSDPTIQKGWLANPMQRVYFSDVDNFYIGNPENIENYTTLNNTDVFQLADDIERLPEIRIKVPVGIRLNYFINEFLVLRTYYRYYSDDWGINSNTFSIELPIKVGSLFTLYPSFRHYNQTAADYFAPFEQHLTSEEYYTSDFDLSKFSSNQYGFGIAYTDILTKKQLWKIGLKNISLSYNYYERNISLKAHIISVGIKLIID